MTRYGFNIRTRSGQRVDNICIMAASQADAERRLLPLAAERGIAVLANRPLQLGGLFAKVKSRALPPWAAELGIGSWAQYFLKFAVSHPAVTCVIPATSKVEHMEDDMAAARGRLPDAAERERMVRFVETR